MIRVPGEVARVLRGIEAGQPTLVTGTVPGEAEEIRRQVAAAQGKTTEVPPGLKDAFDHAHVGSPVAGQDRSLEAAATRAADGVPRVKPGSLGIYDTLFGSGDIGGPFVG